MWGNELRSCWRRNEKILLSVLDCSNCPCEEANTLRCEKQMASFTAWIAERKIRSVRMPLLWILASIILSKELNNGLIVQSQTLILRICLIPRNHKLRLTFHYLSLQEVECRYFANWKDSKMNICQNQRERVSYLGETGFKK